MLHLPPRPTPTTTPALTAHITEADTKNLLRENSSLALLTSTIPFAGGKSTLAVYPCLMLVMQPMNGCLRSPMGAADPTRAPGVPAQKPFLDCWPTQPFGTPPLVNSIPP